MAGEIPENAAEKGGLIYQGTYEEYKSALDTEIRKTAEGFVRVGYLLKIARDTNILYESGYGSVAEFAQAEYGLTKDVVSRYIAINDKYSEGGYSDRLQNRFQGFGVAKLAEMLTLPDSVIQAMDPQLTKAQIREVKEEVKTEMEITPIEVLMEPQEEAVKEMSAFEMFLHEFFRQEPGKFVKVHAYTRGDTNLSDNKAWIEHTLDTIFPTGTGYQSVRIPGKGRIILFVHGRERPLELIVIREDLKQEISWSLFRETAIRMCCRNEDPRAAWSQIYETEFPQEPEKEEAEAGKEEKQPEAPKEGKKSPIGKLKETIRKVTGKEKKESKKVAPAQPEDAGRNGKDAQSDQENAQSDRENAQPDQENAQNNQENAHTAEKEPEEPEAFTNPPEVVQGEEDGMDYYVIRGAIKSGITDLGSQFISRQWDGMIRTIERMKNDILKLKEAEERQGE